MHTLIIKGEVGGSSPPVGFRSALYLSGMNAIARFWARQLAPERFKVINGYMTLFWILMIPISAMTGLLSSVEFVSALSLYALVTGHLSSWISARVEVRQEQDQTEDIVKKIHEEIKS